MNVRTATKRNYSTVWRFIIAKGSFDGAVKIIDNYVSCHPRFEIVQRFDLGQFIVFGQSAILICSAGKDVDDCPVMRAYNLCEQFGQLGLRLEHPLTNEVLKNC